MLQHKFFYIVFIGFILTISAEISRIYVCFGGENDELDRFYSSSDLCELSHTTVASAVLNNTINQTGWGVLDLKITSNDLPDYAQAYAVGYAEGQITATLIQWHVYNTVDGYCNGAEEYCDRLANFMLKNYMWMVEQINQNPTDIYWRQVNFTLNQLYGMIDGYEENGLSIMDQPPNNLVIHPIFMIQIPGDLFDLEFKFQKPTSTNPGGHCSAFIKLTADNELLFAHTTWNSYSYMLRLQKRYDFRLCQCGKIPGHTVVLSGYPGMLSSLDDFVLTSAQLAITETTLNSTNRALLKYTTPASMLTWIRSQVTHRLARTAHQWMRIFSKYNSGTYNNQWMIVDYKRLTTNDDGLFYVLEQLPGLIVYEDASAIIRREGGYWPSYNMPYFERIYNASGTRLYADKYGSWYTYAGTPRAQIFARDQHTVTDMQSLIKLMRYNNFAVDKLSRCNCSPPYSAINAIAGRSDLNPKNGTYPFWDLSFRNIGAIDLKATNSGLMKSLQFLAIAGPTNNPLPVFDWRNDPFGGAVRHFGQPNRFDFKPFINDWNIKH